ncbi:hypothetical protein [Paenibacillus sp. sgz500958]|uniref:hypothetical protein n=1 Tax=Paenibacillus sp. sgz500958 TaxID=3242475 RepID=UPI0036D23339
MEKERQLAAFITGRMTGPYGVYTNRIDTDQSGINASGHEVLSESASIMMRYAALAGEKELFDKHWQLAKDTFNMQGSFSYRYSPINGKKYPVNAAVDDLRLIRALYEAGEAFKDSSYMEEADQYGERFYNNNVKNGYMYDLYDENYKVNNKWITLCYINLSTLRNLSINSSEKLVLVGNMQKIAENGYLSDAFPFYETRFNVETGQYSSEDINTLESLLTIWNLAEIGAEKSSSIRYIKAQVREGTLYGKYTRDGVPLNSIQSTAIYAAAAMIGAEIGDEELYLNSMERMNQFRIVDKTSVLYGGFGDAGSGQAYSFDNLMALLAYKY